MSRGRNYHSPQNDDTNSDSFTLILEAVGQEGLVVGLGDFILKATYLREGSDLVLTGSDGVRVLIRDFFAGDNPADLLTVNGAIVDGQTAARLAGPLAPGQYAQAAASGQNPIGTVENVTGQATAQRADGSKVWPAIEKVVR